MSSISTAQNVETVGRATARPLRIGRRVWAVVAGLLVNVIAASATDAVLHATGVFPPVGVQMSSALFALALAYRTLYGVLGSYATARIAPDRPMQHSLVLAGIGVTIGTIGTIVMWDAGPAWYPLAVIAVTFPAAWAGARLHTQPRR